MNRILSLSAVFLLVAATPALAMKNGVVKFFNEAKGFGRVGVVVIDPTGSPELNPGDTVVISGKSTEHLVVGEIVSFDTTCDTSCGVDPPNLKVIGKATVIESTPKTPGINFKVGPGEVLLIRGAGTTRGHIDLHGGALVITGDATFEGEINSHRGSTVVVEDGSTIGGRLESEDAAALVLRDATVAGRVRSSGDDYVVLARGSFPRKGQVSLIK